MMVKIDMLNIHLWCGIFFAGEVVSWVEKNRSCSWSIQGPGKVSSNFMSGGKVKTFDWCMRLKKFEWILRRWQWLRKYFIFMMWICCFDSLKWWAIQPIASLISLSFLKTKKKATFVWPLIPSDPNFLRLDVFRRTISVQRPEMGVGDATKVTGSRVRFRMSSLLGHLCCFLLDVLFSSGLFLFLRKS